MRVKIFVDSYEASSWVFEQINRKKIKNIMFPTGNTPKQLYSIIREKYKEGNFDPTDRKGFNLDEYAHSNEYKEFMRENLYDEVPMKHYIFDGMASDLEAECNSYQEILNVYGMDLAITGISSENGHQAFNEPDDCAISSRCRVVKLSEETRRVNEVEHTHALTVGIGDILDAEEIICMAFGKGKADIIRRLLSGEEMPTTPLLDHPNFTLCLDMMAISECTLPDFDSKKVLVFSPHPDDEVIGMSVALSRMFAEGANVDIVYMTDGSGGGDPMVREKEAVAGIKTLGGDASNCHIRPFPFYSTDERAISNDDLMHGMKILSEFEPDVVFICGDLYDPKGTHTNCYIIAERAIRDYNIMLKVEKGISSEVSPVEIYEYEGAWKDFHKKSDEIIIDDRFKITNKHTPTHFVMFSDYEMDMKLNAIKAHKSQLIPVNGNATAPFWKRMIVRNYMSLGRYREVFRRI